MAVTVTSSAPADGPHQTLPLRCLVFLSLDPSATPPHAALTRPPHSVPKLFLLRDCGASLTVMKRLGTAAAAPDAGT